MTVLVNIVKLKVLIGFFIFQGLVCSVYKNPSVEHGFTQTLLAERTPGAHGAVVSFSYAKGSSSFDEFGQTAPLFGCFGPTDFYQLTKLHKIFDKDPVTSNFIQEVCAKGNGATPLTSTGPLYSAQDQVLYVDGKISLARTQLDVFFDLQNGLAFTIELPIIVTNCQDLKFVSRNGSSTTFSDLVNENVGSLLDANGIERLEKGHSVCSFGDAKLGLVWSEQFHTDASWAKVKNISIGIGGFLLIPTSMPYGYTKQFLYSIPAGDNGSFGLGMRADATIDLKENVSLMASAESKVFFQQNCLMRAKLFSKQSGLLINPPVHVWFDNGSAWRLFAGVKFDIPKIKSNVFAGYFYDSKEATQLSISDQELASNRVFDLVTEKPITDGTQKLNQIYYGAITLPSTTADFQNEIKSPTKLQAQVLSSERSLQRQYAHWVSMGFSLERRRAGLGCSSQDLVISFNYSYPIFGKNRFILNTFSGCLGASAKIEF